jgi:hypothetical protein
VIVRDAVPGTIIKQKDIINARQKLRVDALDGRTPTQAFLHILQEMGIKHRFRLSDDGENRLVGVVWTYAGCEAMWKRFPEVLGMDNTFRTNRFKMPFFQVVATTDLSSNTLVILMGGQLAWEVALRFRWRSPSCCSSAYSCSRISSGILS